ncbi:unnamed protein product [Penicillium discolor]
MTRGRAEVLGDGDDVAAGIVEVLQRLDDLLRLLAHAEDEVRLRDESGVAGLRENVEGALIAERRSDALEDAGHGLHVVREHLGTGIEDLAEEGRVRVVLVGQQLHAGVRVQLVDLAHRLGVEPGPGVGEVVAGHAPACALGAADEEGRLPVLPALIDVRAAGLLAHRVQVLALDERVQGGVLRPHLGPGLDPLGLALDRGLGVADLEAEELAPLGCGGHAGTPRADHAAGHLAHRGHAGVGDAAGDDVAEGGETVVAVDGEAVHGHALLHPHADRGHLVLRERSAHPHTAAPLDLVPVDPERTQHLDEDPLQTPDVRKIG